ncbi:hypothetical protein FJ872_01555 [Mesorhizobium sp. B2-5-9]|nr:hypothetical protein FJ872_01555 [Mesorhizobium sp. B2-5-9]
MKNQVEGAGDVWTWTALDSDSKLIISWLVGGRDGEYALAFMEDVKCLDTANWVIAGSKVPAAIALRPKPEFKLIHYPGCGELVK